MLDTLIEQLPQVVVRMPLFGSLDITVYIAALCVFLILSGFFWLVRAVLIVRLQRWSKSTTTDIDDTIIKAVQSIRSWVYMLVAVYLALLLLPLPGVVHRVLTGIVLFALVWQFIEIALHFIRYATSHYMEKDSNSDGLIDDPNAATASHMIQLLARVTLWVFGVLFVLANLGIEITALIAGLGIGGIAVAFALQGILTDLFASFSLYFDKPFRIGDFVVIGNDMGVVEKIGIKTTRIRTLQGEELVVSNAELTTVRVQNFKRMKERYIQFSINVVYQTPLETVKRIPALLQAIITQTNRVRFDRAHFAKYDENALRFDIAYYILSEDYSVYMDVQQEINFAIMDAFAKEGITFALPTQRVFVEKEG